MDGLPDVGRRIRIHVETLEEPVHHEGIVLPGVDSKLITIKLDNGYNTNYPISSIISWDYLDTDELVIPAEHTIKPEFSDSLPRVRLIHTGGTIASKVDYQTGAVVARFEPEELIAELPQLMEIAHLETFKIGNMFSDDIRPQHWNAIGEATKKAFDDGCRGVIVSHGTDTLHLSSAALAFIWAGEGGCPPGPIAFVGSQRSSDRGSSDAAENLLAAVYWAAHGPLPCGDAGDATVLVMHETSDDGRCTVLPGVSSRKLHSSRRDAFKPINADPLASISYNGSVCSHELTEDYEHMLESSSRTPTETIHPFLTHLKIIQFIGGPYLLAEHIEASIKDGCDAMIIHGTGLGHLPLEDSMNDAPENLALWRTLVRCSNREIPIVIANQCIFGPVNMDVYSKGREQQKIGILGHGLSSAPDTVAIKTHWLLSAEKNVAQTIQKNLCGEHNVRLNE